MPPMHNYTFRALFYYTIAKTTDEYWATEGKYWSKNVDRFIDAGKLSSIATRSSARRIRQSKSCRRSTAQS